ncbi:OsmC family protein [Crenalkalicoccus roseus]|uniref:OsmC family protein n=1 Tax=Crenalkalicoccus roseus TaxID=1485588 RepID=UPI0018644431|nr:OsmC family protein [Crenalkalicoccus roseus]
MASIRRTGSARWQGTGKEGKGTLATQSGTLRDTPYSATARFGDAQGTNPEELIAAAHAGCFTMALAFKLSGAGHAPETLSTEARLSMEQEGGGWTIKAIALTLRGKVPGVSAEEFRRLAEEAKATCPVSRVLKAEITLEAALE